MKSTLEQFQNTCAAGSDACAEVMTCVLGSVGDFCDFQFARTRQVFEENVAQLQTLLGAKAPSDLASFQVNALQPAFEQCVSYVQGLVGLATKMQCDLAGIAETQQKEMARKVVSLTERISAGAPANSELMVAGVQSWLEAANQALEGAARVSREMGGLVESGAAAPKAAKSASTRHAKAA